MPALEAWRVAEQVAGLSFDTTAANTARSNGTCVLKEQQLEKNTLYFDCRHHILEIMIQTIFSHLLGTFSSPDVLLFKRFQAKWKNIDCKAFATGMQVQR